ncbi:MAG: hypothetical protein ACYCPM_02980 [Acidobacteriaceae bacterium]
MATVVVGGHTRNIGKTSVVAGLIAALPELEWTAFKVTQFGHGICSANGEACDCETGAHTVAVAEERSAESGTDSARFLAAGAVRSFWVRTRQGQLAEAMPRVRKELALARNAILESNSIVRFLKPDLYLTVLDPAIRDFKPSAQYFLDRADAVLWSGTLSVPTEAAWPAALLHLARSKPQFVVQAPAYISDALTRFVAERIARDAETAARTLFRQ